MPNDDFKPSATVDEAIERYTAVVEGRIAQLTKQRDDLALCLYDFVQGFERGYYVAAIGRLPAFTGVLNRAQAALLNNEVLHHLETAVAIRMIEHGTDPGTT